MKKPKGKAALPLFEKLLAFDSGTEAEKTFHWLYLPHPAERTPEEANIHNHLVENCQTNKVTFSTVKKDCDCDKDIYNYEATINKRSRALEFDFYLPKYHVAVEFDELQHFSMERHATYELYPLDGFSYDIQDWQRLCLKHAKCDTDPPCRDWKRAFRDTVRDLRARKEGLPLIRLYVKDFNAKALESADTLNKLHSAIEKASGIILK